MVENANRKRDSQLCKAFKIYGLLLVACARLPGSWIVLLQRLF